MVKLNAENEEEFKKVLEDIEAELQAIDEELESIEETVRKDIERIKQIYINALGGEGENIDQTLIVQHQEYLRQKRKESLLKTRKKLETLKRDLSILVD